MKVNGIPMRSIWPIGDEAVGVVDQSVLPHRFETRELASAAAVEHAIRTMVVRGAPLIGVTGAYGLALALRSDASDAALAAAHTQLLTARPTAVNLRWALDRMRAVVAALPPARRAAAAWLEAGRIAEEDVALNRAIGTHGAALMSALHTRHRRAINVLTHCNAGWLAAVDHGTALAAIYAAHDGGTPLHVWVDETRPRNQGLLTAWELAAHGVPHTLIVDNAGGHLMQHGQVDLVIVGADRVSARGDVANKIGTYLKALAAHDNGVPFYAAVPSPTIDWTLADGAAIPIEERAAGEVLSVHGIDVNGAPAGVRLATSTTQVANPAFDVTPARLVTGIVTERGVSEPGRLSELFPEQRRAA
ncbi:MAG TPA: S-methyl-5-thioribose-1-phosphate isomerase [Burkholderiaceae bacterium]|nr:S-methyl-5-thioribose-1-phosphate isomerase [Burkholderiaceae bacterium]HQR69315.1 S-methyl-5-thioribose-1-phosphate isomerase [Burkholderiaceae bacterium]